MNRLERILLSLGFGLLLIVACYTLIQRGLSLSSITRIAICLVPLAIIVTMRLASVWLGLIIGSFAFTFSFPLPVLQRLEPSIYLLMMIGAIFILRSSLRPPRLSALLHIESLAMLVCAILITGRFLYDRPGSAQLGQVGGAGEATVYVIGVLSYFLVAIIASENYSIKINIRLAFKLVIVGVLIDFFLMILNPSSRATFSQHLFRRPVWVLMPMIIAMSMQKDSLVRKTTNNPRVPLPLLSTAATLILGISTPFRSRPFFAVAMVLGVSYFYGRLRRFALTLIPILMLLLVIIFLFGEDKLSPKTARSLSTLLPVDKLHIAQTAKEYGMSSESGWQSRFRGRMYHIAWEKIREKPWFGKGFSLSRTELIFALSGARDFERTTYSLAMSGGYHNSVLTIAVFCGVPCALSFLVALGISFLNVIRTNTSQIDSHTKLLVASLFGFFLPCVGQMLMNGTSKHFFVVCVLMGLIRGIINRINKDLTHTPALPVERTN